MSTILRTIGGLILGVSTFGPVSLELARETGEPPDSTGISVISYFPFFVFIDSLLTLSYLSLNVNSTSRWRLKPRTIVGR